MFQHNLEKCQSSSLSPRTALQKKRRLEKGVIVREVNDLRYTDDFSTQATITLPLTEGIYQLVGYLRSIVFNNYKI